MTRWLRLGVGLVVGLVIGAVSVLALQDATTAPGPPATPAPSSTGAPVVVGTTIPTATAAEPILLAWTSAPLRSEVVGRVRAAPGIRHATAVRRNELDLTQVADASGTRLEVAAGRAVPVDTVAFDPATYLDLVPPDAVAVLGSLRDDEVVLSRAGARLRGVGPGATLELSGRPRRVAAVVDDDVIGGAEAALTTTAGATAGLEYDRYLLVVHDGDRAAAEAAVRAAVDAPDAPPAADGPRFAAPGDQIRFRGPGETPFLRNADAVLTLAAVKEAFGEFAIARTPLVQDAAWADANLVNVELPVLGRVRCHRAIVPALRGALEELDREQLGYLVDPSSSVACWRLGTIGTERRLSREAWGIGVELNSAKNPTGSGSAQDRRMIEILERWGFAWGGRWLVPEPSYFEYVGPPRG